MHGGAFHDDATGRDLVSESTWNVRAHGDAYVHDDCDVCGGYDEYVCRVVRYDLQASQSVLENALSWESDHDDEFDAASHVDGLRSW